MPEFLFIIPFVIITTFAGLNIVILFDRQNAFNLPEKLGLSYLFGIATISLELFILGLFRVKFSSVYALLPWVALVILNAARYRPRKTALEGTAFARLNLFEKLMLSLLSFEVIYVFFRALMKPIEAYDSIAIWALKAKVLYLAKTLPSNFFRMIDATFHGIHADYPLLLPFSEVWFYTLLGNFNDYLVKIIFPLNFLAFLLLFYFILKRATGKRNLALLFTFILASVKQFNDYATVGMADFHMAVYAFLAFGLLFIWVKQKSTAYLTASVISCAFAFWTKNEGSIVLLVTLALMAGLLFIKRAQKSLGVNDSRYLIFAIFILLALFAAWAWFKATLHLESDIINAGTFQNIRPAGIFKRIIPIAYEYQKHIFGFKKWNLIWIAFLYIVIVRFKRLFVADKGYIAFPLAAVLLAYSVIYLITPQEIHWHLRTSASRLLIHILPLAVFFIALNVNEAMTYVGRGDRRKSSG